MTRETDIVEAAQQVLQVWDDSDGRIAVWLLGDAGTSKTRVAQRAAAMLPKLTSQDWYEVVEIYADAGIIDREDPDPRHSVVKGRPPFRAPHHTISEAAMIGLAGSRRSGEWYVRTGEVTLAHCGVLFLDDAPEFRRDVLGAAWRAFDDCEVALPSDGGVPFVLPAHFNLLLASNLCPCGSERRCVCTDAQVERYLKRLTPPAGLRDDVGLVVVRVGPR